MPQFKRFVAYLYYYENDTKEYLAGFARVEMRGEICRLEIHLKGTEYAGQEGKVSLFIRREGKILAFPGIAIAKTRDRFTVFRISPGMRS